MNSPTSTGLTSHARPSQTGHARPESKSFPVAEQHRHGSGVWTVCAGWLPSFLRLPFGAQARMGQHSTSPATYGIVESLKEMGA
jgi:hypothetical protein